MTGSREPVRRPDSSSLPFIPRPAAPVVGQALRALPWFLVSLVIVSIIGTMPGYPWGWLVIAVWLLSGAVALVASFERLVARYVLRLREPTGVERERLKLTWRPVAHVAGLAESSHQLWVRDSAVPVTAAVPGQGIAVTAWAAGMLQPRQLEAVIAREVSRDRRGSRTVSLLAYWYSVPARLVAGALRGIYRGVAAVIRAVPFIGWIIAAFLLMCWIGMLLTTLIRRDGPITYLWLVTPVVAPLLLAAWSRYVEKHADRGAETLGYGSSLVEAFNVWQAGQAQPPRRESILDTQPSVLARLRSLDRHLTKRR